MERENQSKIVKAEKKNVSKTKIEPGSHEVTRRRQINDMKNN